MSRRSIIRDFQVISSADTTSPITSIKTDISGVDSVVYRVSTGAAVNANLSVKFSNKEDQSNPGTLKFSAPITLVGATDTESMITIQNKGFRWLWIEIANNGGTGTVSAWITGTTVGA